MIVTGYRRSLLCVRRGRAIPFLMPLVAENLTFAYRHRPPVLDSVSLALPEGSITAIAGPNGAGKSTLLKVLLGLLTPSAGEVRLGSTPVDSLPYRTRAVRLVYVPQRTSLAFGFTVREYVALGRYAAGDRAGAGRTAIDRAMERADIADRAEDPFPVLSAGQQQRATLARALAQLDTPGEHPRAVLADEPVSAMDPRHALLTMGILREIAAGGNIVAVVLHDLTLAARFCDRAVLLSEKGRIAAAGPAAEAMSNAALGEVFGVSFERLMIPGGGPVLVPSADARIAP
jgi:iron complex transport system ATP-binding protein